MKTKKFGMPKGAKFIGVGDSNEARKRHVGSSVQAARLGSYAHKAAFAAAKPKRYK